MTIYENVAYGIRHHEVMCKSQMNDRVEQALQQSALWEEVKDKLNQMHWACPGPTTTAMHRTRSRTNTIGTTA